MSKRIFSAGVDKLYEMLDFVKDYCSKKNVDSTSINKIILATEEAVVNVIKHGYSSQLTQTNKIEIECEDCSNSKPGIKIIIKDHGIPFNPLEKIKEIPKTSLGGHGIFLYFSLMDKIEYAREENTNFLYLIKYFQ